LVRERGAYMVSKVEESVQEKKERCIQWKEGGKITRQM
jgi:hypothetical protein